MISRFYSGVLAEYITLLWYILQGYRFLELRYKTYSGEIDLIMSKGSLIVFIEVKYKKYGLQAGVVSNHQQQRIKSAASLFLARQHHKYPNPDVRFDLAVIKPYNWPQIIKNAW